MVAGVLIPGVNFGYPGTYGADMAGPPVSVWSAADGDGLRQTEINGGLWTACNAFGSRPS